MATKVVKGGPGILSNLGNLAALGGMVTGQPWLTALGTGMKATDTLINGSSDADSQTDALEKLKNVITGWKNPASGNIAKTAGTVANAARNVSPYVTDEELARKWSPYNNPYGIH